MVGLAKLQQTKGQDRLFIFDELTVRICCANSNRLSNHVSKSGCNLGMAPSVMAIKVLQYLSQKFDHEVLQETVLSLDKKIQSLKDFINQGWRSMTDTDQPRSRVRESAEKRRVAPEIFEDTKRPRIDSVLSFSDVQNVRMGESHRDGQEHSHQRTPESIDCSKNNRKIVVNDQQNCKGNESSEANCEDAVSSDLKNSTSSNLPNSARKSAHSIMPKQDKSSSRDNSSVTTTSSKTACSSTVTAFGGSNTASSVSATANGVNATANGVSATANSARATATGVSATANCVSATANDGSATAISGCATSIGDRAKPNSGSATSIGGSATDDSNAFTNGFQDQFLSLFVRLVSSTERIASALENIPKSNSS